jgi:hypothetical protein
MTPENNPGWRMKWLYIKDQPSVGREIRLEEFRVASDLRARQSWENSLSEEEMALTEPLMLKIQDLHSTPGKKVTGLQLIRTFIERRVQPLAARAHSMWDYSGRKDLTRLLAEEE